MVFFAAAATLPLLALAIGWYVQDLETGIQAGLITFGVLFLISALFALLVNSPSWIDVAMPYLMAVVYAILPTVPGPFDNVVVTGVGGLLTFILWVKKQPDVPKWIVLPLLASAVYALVGGFIPLPFDELIVDGLAILISLWGASRKSQVV